MDDPPPARDGGEDRGPQMAATHQLVEVSDDDVEQHRGRDGSVDRRGVLPRRPPLLERRTTSRSMSLSASASPRANEPNSTMRSGAAADTISSTTVGSHSNRERPFHKPSS